jgi:threonine/homoserine/homoserine lactone efflux protein
VNLTPDPAGLTLGGLVLTSFVLGLSGAVIPGPVMAVTIGHSARLGIKAGPLVVLGHAVLEGGLFLALAAGLGGILVRPEVAGTVGAVGALILIWMAVGMLRSLPGLKLDWSAGGGRAAAPVRDGFLLTLANPSWSLWWSTVGLSLMAMVLKSDLAWLGLAALFIGHIGSDLAWYLLVSMVVAKGRRWLTDRLHRWVVGACAIFLLGFAVYFGLFALRQLGVLGA